MAIYHCSISNVSRAKGSSACATLSYITGEKIKSEYTGETFNYGRKQRIVHVDTIIPDYAPADFKNPAVLFNAIECYEKAENARTAKKIEIALPKEFDKETQISVIEDFIRTNFTTHGYCATYALHVADDGTNPHAHILLANRQLNEKGEWNCKRKMEYILDAGGNRIPRTDVNGNQIVDSHGRKQWQRRSAEQNPLDKKEFLKEIRKGWEIACNTQLKKEMQIDCRSFTARSSFYKPQIHEGYAARQIEARGGVSDRCEENRKIKKLNEKIKQLLMAILSYRQERINAERELKSLTRSAKVQSPEPVFLRKIEGCQNVIICFRESDAAVAAKSKYENANIVIAQGEDALEKIVPDDWKYIMAICANQQDRERAERIVGNGVVLTPLEDLAPSEWQHQKDGFDMEL